MGTSVRVPVLPRQRVEPMDLRGVDFPAARARHWAIDLVREWFNIPPDADHDLVDVVGLLITELVTNAERHAGCVLCALMLVRPDGRLFMKVVDRDPHHKPALPNHLAEYAEQGRGIELIDALSEEWGADCDFDKNIKTVWALLNFNV